MRKRRERGFTLIELMIALVVSSLLVGLILAIFLRLSFAYRTQQQVSSVQQVLSAGGSALQQDAQHAGLYLGSRFMMPDGSHSSIVVADSSTGPDQVGFYYADASAVAFPTGGLCSKTGCQVDDTTAFAIGDVVVMTTPVIVAGIGANETMTKFYACTLEVSGKAVNNLTFTGAGPWGSGGNTHCSDIPPGAPEFPAGLALPVTAETPGAPPVIVERTRFYKLIAHAYRIDPGRPGQGVLQMSPTGNLIGLNDWRDLGFAFTDLQVATRFYLDAPGIDEDGDLDPQRDWFSGPTQDVRTAVNGPIDVPIAINLSLVARTERNVEGIATDRTPVLLGAPANNNPLGNHDFVDLLTTPDPTLQGPRIYRFTSFRVDLRNLGIDR